MQHIHRFSYMESERPALVGILHGGLGHEDINGTAAVFWLPEALYFEAQFTGLPPSEVFGLHIHDGIFCGSAENGFEEAGDHFTNCGDIGIWCDKHPYHAGDLPPVFSDEDGNAVMGVYLGKVSAEEISGKTIVLHNMRDDFTTQPSGGSGVRIACGIIGEYL